MSTSKFAASIAASNKEIKAKRAEHVAATAKVAAEQKLSELNLQKQEIELAISDLTDLSPTKTTNLNIGEKFEATKWVAQFLEYKKNLALKNFEIDAMKSIIAEWFTEQVDNAEA